MADYKSHKGVEAPLVMMGLSGFYIVVAIAIIVVSFILAIILSSTTLPILLSVSIPVFTALGLLQLTAYLSGKYGINGLMKQQVLRSFPEYVKRTIRIHILLKRKSNDKHI